ncbi:Myo-inositol-1(or 4)-monophosphatase [Granulibacter bethesdensis]|uniref:Inositol-1-monophosphatase n=2 Tax=Granulibacter bethesdensis TaxID=364410 RepID=A0AAN0RDI4_9PROT|nr:Myo-inositol-1(or 4)-monophosphatase [Granulibacter bethesdensis]
MLSRHGGVAYRVIPSLFFFLRPERQRIMALRLSPHMTVMQNAAQRAAKRLLRDFNEVEQLQVSVKGPSDFVSQADLRSEQSIRDDLTKARPGYALLMEESGASGGDNWTWRWVVDPLDGTTNFLHGIPHWAISIGLERRLPDGNTELAAAVVYSPAVDEMFWAEKGAGAFLNERRLRVSARRELHDAVFATGIPFAAVSAPRRLAFARTLGTLMPQVAGIRRFGSAALDLAWVAAGRYDGFWELGLKPWDVAAGLLLVREAGGYAVDPAGGDPLQTGDVVASNGHLHTKLLDIVQDGVAASRTT